MVIFISGASGYLGSNLVKALSKEHCVFALVRETSSIERIKDIDVNLIYVDDVKELERSFEAYCPDIIINTAALYGRKGESLTALVTANIDFPIKLYELANKYNSKAFIHTGTSLPDDISQYALTKNTFVKLAKFNSEYKPKFIDITLEHFYGPNDDNSKFTSYVINSCLAGDKLTLTHGLQQRDFIYIDDVITAYKTLVDNLDKLGQCETISVGSGTAPTIKEFVEMVHTCSGSKSMLEFGAVAMRSNEIMYSCANTSRLNTLGWTSKINLKDGVQKVLNSYGN